MQVPIDIISPDRVPVRPRPSQLAVLAGMLVVYALTAALYIVVPGGMLDPRSAAALGMPAPTPTMPVWQLVLGNVGLIGVGYGLLGLVGLWLSRRAALPGIYRSDAGWRAWVVRPLGLGVLVGVILVAGDVAAQRLTGRPTFPHPPFPASILASLGAGIGEEILTRLVVLSLWAVVLTWLRRRLTPGGAGRRAALWLATVIAALVFGATHLPAVMLLAGVSTPAALPPVLLAELFLLNGLLGVVAGRAFIRDGLVAASGVHFWADMIWHVVYGLLV